MSDPVFELTISTVTSMIVWVLAWSGARFFGVFDGSAAFNADRIGTWSFPLVMASGAIFGLTVGIGEVAFNESIWTRAIYISVAVLAAFVLVPRVWKKLSPPTASQRSDARLED